MSALFENSIVCQVFYVLNSSPTNVLFVGGFFLLISLSTNIFFELVFLVLHVFLESLILAQDERWRRA